MIRRAREYYEFGPFRVDAAERVLLHGGEVVPLTPKVFDTLLVLVENSGHTLTKNEMMNLVWPDATVEESNLTTNISVLRKAMGERSGRHQYIETIPWRGYRFVASVREVRDESPDLIVEETTSSRVVIDREQQTIAPVQKHDLEQCTGPSAPPSDSESKIAPTWRLNRAVIAGCAVLVLIAAGVLVGLANRSKPAPPDSNIRTIAVLPFKPISADARDEYFELGMADALITKLGSLKGIIVRPTTSVRRYADAEQDAMAAGQELQVESVLVGSTQRLGDRVRLTVQLVNVSDGRSLWSYKCDDYCADIFTAQDSISEKIATALALKLNDEERRRLGRHDTENLDAYDLYLKGRYRWDRGTVKEVLRSIEYFEQAIKLDPNYTLAYTGLADAYFYLEGLGAFPSKEVGPKARYAALKALELDEGLPETHASLGLIKHWHDWDWVGAEREFKRGIELNPNSAIAHNLYGKCLADTGRFDEALSELRMALVLDPYSVNTNRDLGETLYYARRYDEAIEQFQKTLNVEPNYLSAYFWLSRIYEAKGQYDAAMTAELAMIALSGTSPDVVAKAKEVYAASGWRGYLERKLDYARGRIKRGYYEPFRVAAIYARLGKKEMALDWLDKAYEDRSSWILTMKNDAALDPLRTHPRFIELLRRAGLSL